jgi:hypothetical protein
MVSPSFPRTVGAAPALSVPDRAGQWNGLEARGGLVARLPSATG